MGRYAGAGTFRAVVHGRVAGRPVTLPLDLVLPDDTRDAAGQALPILWARAWVADRMTSYRRPDLSAEERETLKEEVVALGLEHRLVTQWTSFVAVGKEIVNPGGEGVAADVPVPPVAFLRQTGSAPEAPGKMRFLPNGPAVAASSGGAVGLPAPGAPRLSPAPPTGSERLVASGGFAGSAAPEPATGMALAFMATAGVALAAWNRRRLRGIQARDAQDPRRRRRRTHP